MSPEGKNVPAENHWSRTSVTVSWENTFPIHGRWREVPRLQILPTACWPLALAEIFSSTPEIRTQSPTGCFPGHIPRHLNRGQVQPVPPTFTCCFLSLWIASPGSYLSNQEPGCHPNSSLFLIHLRQPTELCHFCLRALQPSPSLLGPLSQVCVPCPLLRACSPGAGELAGWVMTQNPMLIK